MCATNLTHIICQARGLKFMKPAYTRNHSDTVHTVAVLTPRHYVWNKIVWCWKKFFRHERSETKLKIFQFKSIHINRHSLTHQQLTHDKKGQSCLSKAACQLRICFAFQVHWNDSISWDTQCYTSGLTASYHECFWTAQFTWETRFIWELVTRVN